MGKARAGREARLVDSAPLARKAASDTDGGLVEGGGNAAVSEATGTSFQCFPRRPRAARASRAHVGEGPARGTSARGRLAGIQSALGGPNQNSALHGYLSDGTSVRGG